MSQYTKPYPKPDKAKKDLHKFAKAITKLAKRKPIKKVSKKMAKNLKTYSVLRKEHLTKYPNCQIKLIGCTHVATEVHHASRRGVNLNEKGSFLSSCRTCHNQIEFVLSAKERRERGFLI